MKGMFEWPRRHKDVKGITCRKKDMPHISPGLGSLCPALPSFPPYFTEHGRKESPKGRKQEAQSDRASAQCVNKNELYFFMSLSETLRSL